jgi:hypothetical protein
VLSRIRGSSRKGNIAPARLQVRLGDVAALHA